MLGGNLQGVKLLRTGPTRCATGSGRTELQPRPGRTAELRDNKDGIMAENRRLGPTLEQHIRPSRGRPVSLDPHKTTCCQRCLAGGQADWLLSFCHLCVAFQDLVLLKVPPLCAHR